MIQNLYLIEKHLVSTFLQYLWKEEKLECLLFLRSFNYWFWFNNTIISFTVNSFICSQCCELLNFSWIHMKSHPHTQCCLWWVKGSRCYWWAAGRPLKPAPRKLQITPFYLETWPLLLFISRWKCILLTFFFGWFLAPKPLAEAWSTAFRVWILSKSHSSLSKFKEKCDSAGVVSVRVSPTVSNLSVGHTRRQRAVIIPGLSPLVPCMLPAAGAAFLGFSGTNPIPRAPEHKMSAQ